MPSFDIASKTDIHEIDNAIAGVRREVETRFDFKGSKCTVERTENDIVLLADDEPKLLQMQELLRIYVTRRKLDASALDFSAKPERAANDSLRHTVTVKQGIAQELAKRIVKSIKDSKMKVQVSIQGDELRVTGKKRDDLQEAIAHVKRMGIEQPLQYDNFRD
jgi:cyclic-di-GMP-binding protein